MAYLLFEWNWYLNAAALQPLQSQCTWGESGDSQVEDNDAYPYPFYFFF